MLFLWAHNKGVTRVGGPGAHKRDLIMMLLESVRDPSIVVRVIDMEESDEEPQVEQPTIEEADEPKVDEPQVAGPRVLEPVFSAQAARIAKSIRGEIQIQAFRIKG